MKKIKNLIIMLLCLFLTYSIVIPAKSVTGESVVKTFIQTIKTSGLRNVSGDTSPVEMGWGGMKITVGSKDLHITAVGRMNVEGCAKTHNMLIADASDDSIVIAGISVNTPASAKNGEFAYASVSNIILKAGKSYYIASDFQGATDAWYDHSVATTTKDAVLDGFMILNLKTNAWNFTKALNTGYGPVDFKYSLSAVTSASSGSKESKPITSVVSNNNSKPVSSQGNSVSESRTIDEIIKSEEIHTYISQYFLNGERNVTVGDAGNYAGWVGMKITVGPEPVLVTALGRIYGPGSDKEHKMIIIDSATDAVVIDNIKLKGEKPGEFSYTNLPRPITLESGKSYYIATDVMSWTDQWYDSASITTNSAVKLNGAVLMGLKGWEFFDVPASWGPVDFKYVKTKAESAVVSESKTESKSILTSSSEVSSDVSSVSSQTSEGEEPENNSTIIIISIAAIAALAVAAGVILYIRKKKKL